MNKVTQLYTFTKLYKTKLRFIKQCDLFLPEKKKLTISNTIMITMPVTINNQTNYRRDQYSSTEYADNYINIDY